MHEEKASLTTTGIGRTVRTHHPAVRPLPHPWHAWLTLSNDPDNTTPAGWDELHRTIWQELGLPFADALFLRSYNTLLPDQVDLHGRPELLAAHPHDSIHTWGDYMFARTRGFDRSDAEAALAWMERIGFRPRVWVDHSQFTGNMLHLHRTGSIPEFRDASGHVYPNPLYTLDLVHAAGVRYLWDGTVTPVLGQDLPLSDLTYTLEHAGDRRVGLAQYARRRVRAGLRPGTVPSARDANRAYRRHRFPDGRTLYIFQRHGQWPLADIDGLGTLLAPERMNALVRRGGVCIAYTHLGKRPAARMADAVHVPPHTRRALEHVATLHRQGRLMVSGTARLLDHLVIRDHIQVDTPERTIRFTADGIAFDRLGAAELAGHAFTFNLPARPPWKVVGTEGVLAPRLEEHGRKTFTLHFDGA